MGCVPECSPWCVCVDDTCVPSAVTVNALRLFTQDGRVLGAATASTGGFILAKQGVVPSTPETFRFVTPAAGPLTSGASLELDGCTPEPAQMPGAPPPPATGWLPLGLRVRVDHTVVTQGPSRKGFDVGGAVTYEVGGTNAPVLLWPPFSPGYPSYPGDDPAERIFTLLKMSGGSLVPAGTPINPGDLCVVRIDSNLGNTYYWRVADEDQRVNGSATICGDGTALGQAGTVFRVEFNEVRNGLGWRPAQVTCQSCAQVTVVVTDARSGGAVAGADAVAQVPDDPFRGTTAADGRVVLTDAANHDCVPAGMVTIEVSGDRHQTESVTVAVPGSGGIEVPVVLECTQVKGKVVDTAGSAVPGKTVYLRDANGNVILDENGFPFRTTTAADGSFVFNCVPHGFVQVWTTAAPTQMQHTRTIGPEGWLTVTIVIDDPVTPPTCGNLVGRVVDAATGLPIPGAVVTESGGDQTVTAVSGDFRFDCLKPAGNRTVFAAACGYAEDFETGSVPSTGDSVPVVIELTRLTVLEIRIRLDWGLQPPDLDSHLSGPDGAAGRFHCAFYAQIPVPFIQLDNDVTTTTGPETITIRRTPSTTSGAFTAGDYRYWVHHWPQLPSTPATTTFAGSNASVAVILVDDQGALHECARYVIGGASGNLDDDLWHVVDMTIDATGGMVRTAVQQLTPGDQDTLL